MKKRIELKTKIDPMETMNTKQPDVISLNGIEIPSYRNFFRTHTAIEERQGRLRWQMLLTQIWCAALTLAVTILVLMK